VKPLDPSGVIVIVNSLLVAIGLVAAGAWLARGKLSATAPGFRQNIGEAVLSFFVGKARGIAHGDQRDRIMHLVTPLLATLFLFIIVSNLFAMVPIPIVNRPPTSHFSVTLALALCAVMSTLILSAALKGTGKTLKHLFWPNPLQWVSEITDVLSLSLRLFGNIAGEYMTVALVILVVPWGIPLILHALGLIPAFVQALVFTLLTTSFLANALHDEGGSRRRPRKANASESLVPSTRTTAEGRS
jgi:F-type H+-transporting ATPase subunit a